MQTQESHAANLSNAVFTGHKGSFSTEELTAVRPDRFVHSIVDEIYRCTPINEFKGLFAELTKESAIGCGLNHEKVVRTQQAFRAMLQYVNDLIYHSERLSDERKTVVGNWIHQEFLAFCLLGTWPSRSLHKPQNIAGDHHTIKQIYSSGNQEKRKIGHVVNHCFLEEPACRAVKNRKCYVRDRILSRLDVEASEPYRVTSVASGPAEEIFEVYEKLGKINRGALKASGVDRDKRACSSVDDTIDALKLNSHFKTHAIDVFRLNPLPSELQNQDLVYSMGLIDYFKDRATVRIINAMYKMLKVGGEIIIGNFHERCSSRVFLDYMLDWPLIYRTEEDMTRLFANSLFGDSPVTIDFEQEGVNMLVRCTKL